MTFLPHPTSSSSAQALLAAPLPPAGLTPLPLRRYCRLTAVLPPLNKLSSAVCRANLSPDAGAVGTARSAPETPSLPISAGGSLPSAQRCPTPAVAGRRRTGLWRSSSGRWGRLCSEGR